MSHSLLGDLLTSEGLLSEVERRQLINKSGSGPASFAKSILFNNILDDYELSAIIANSTEFEMAPADLGQIVDERAFYALDKNLIKALEVMPLSFADNSLRVAMLDPLDRETIRQLEFFSGRKIQALVSPRAELYDAIRNWVPDFTPLEPLNAQSNKITDQEIVNDEVNNPEVPLLLNSTLDATLDATEANKTSASSGLEETNLENLESEFQNTAESRTFELHSASQPSSLGNSEIVDFNVIEEIEEDEELDSGLESLSSRLLDDAENSSEIDLPDDESLINFDQFIDIKTDHQGPNEGSFDTNIAPETSEQNKLPDTIGTMNINNQVEDLTELFFEIPIEKSLNSQNSPDTLEYGASSTMGRIGLDFSPEAEEEVEELEEEVMQEVEQMEKEAAQTTTIVATPAIVEEKFAQVTPRPPFSHTVTAIAALNHARTKLNLCRSTEEAYSIINSTLRKLGIEQALLIKAENPNSKEISYYSGMHFYCRTEKFVPIDPEQSSLNFSEAEKNLSEAWSIISNSNLPLIENLSEENTEICGVRMSIASKTALFICSWLQESAQSLTVKNDLLATLVRLLKVEDLFKK